MKSGEIIICDKYEYLKLIVVRKITKFDLFLLKQKLSFCENRIYTNSLKESIYILIMKQFFLDLKRQTRELKIFFFEVLNVFLKKIKLTKSILIDLLLQFYNFIFSEE